MAGNGVQLWNVLTTRHEDSLHRIVIWSERERIPHNNGRLHEDKIEFRWCSYHGGFCYGAKAVDKDIAGYIHRGAWEDTDTHTHTQIGKNSVRDSCGYKCTLIIPRWGLCIAKCVFTLWFLDDVTPLPPSSLYSSYIYSIYTDTYIYVFVFNGETQSISITESRLKTAPLHQLSWWSNRLTAASQYIFQKNTKRHRIRVEYLGAFVSVMDPDGCLSHSVENFVVVEHTWNMDEAHKLREIFRCRVGAVSALLSTPERARASSPYITLFRPLTSWRTTWVLFHGTLHFRRSGIEITSGG